MSHPERHGNVREAASCLSVIVRGLVGVVDGVDEVSEAETLKVGNVAGGEVGDAVMAKGQGDAGVEHGSAGNAGALRDAPDLVHDWRVFDQGPARVVTPGHADGCCIGCVQRAG